MGLHAGKILEIKVTLNSKKEILEYIQKYIVSNSKVKLQTSSETVKPLVITTPNPEQIVYANKHPWFADIINGSDIAIPDGVGVALATRMLCPISDLSDMTHPVQRLAGVDLMESLIKLSANEGFTIGLIGGRGGVALKAYECLKKKYPSLLGIAEDGPEMEMKSTNLQIYKFTNGVEKKEKSDIQEYMIDLARRISANHVQILFVGLGAPKQEAFIREFQTAWAKVSGEMKKRPDPDVPLVALEPLVIMPVGGAIDMASGKVKRAPVLLRNIGLEWAWRLILEPWRWKRQMALFTFIKLLLFSKIY